MRNALLDGWRHERADMFKVLALLVGYAVLMGSAIVVLWVQGGACQIIAALLIGNEYGSWREHLRKRS